MKKNNEKQSGGLPEIDLGLDELIRRGAREAIQQAIEAELAQLPEQYENVKTLTGSRAVVRNGYLPEREVLTAVGPVAVTVPKVRDRSGSRCRTIHCLSRTSPPDLYAVARGCCTPELTIARALSPWPIRRYG